MKKIVCFIGASLILLGAWGWKSTPCEAKEVSPELIYTCASANMAQKLESNADVNYQPFSPSLVTKLSQSTFRVNAYIVNLKTHTQINYTSTVKWGKEHPNDTYCHIVESHINSNTKAKEVSKVDFYDQSKENLKNDAYIGSTMFVMKALKGAILNFPDYSPSYVTTLENDSKGHPMFKVESFFDYTKSSKPRTRYTCIVMFDKKSKNGWFKPVELKIDGKRIKI